MHAQSHSERTLFLQTATAMVSFLLLLAAVATPLNNLKASSTTPHGQQSALQK